MSEPGPSFTQDDDGYRLVRGDGGRGTRSRARLVIRAVLQATQDALLCGLVATAAHKAAGSLARR